MRTSIFLGLVFVAKAIRDDTFVYGDISTLVIVLFAFFVVMDAMEFINKMNKD